MPLTTGTRIGPYAIVCELGSGGMGQVYRARDTRLDRDVAIKILPDLFATDADRLTRFEREAKTLAALNHPNIAHIHGIEDSGSSRALVMELVEGEDLAARIARGPLPVNDAILIAKQIADALDAAHERGIIHRDLKPANIRITGEGTVKVLDFGLAKAADPEGGPRVDTMNSPTFTSPATQLGLILGTAAYMAPEQATGKAVDKRVDIWAFGVVFWEMLTGQKLFAGDTVSETIAAVIKDAPRLDLLPAETPPALRQLLARCLERDPKLRLRDIGEARILLSQRLDPPRADEVTRSSRRAIWLSAVTAIVLAALAGAAAWYLKPTPSVPLRRFELPAAMADASGALSPDGTRIAYIDRDRLYVRALDSLEAKDLGAMHVTARQLFWSPDSRTIGFTAEGTIRTVPADGGPVFVVCRIPASGRAMDLVWLTSGDIVFSAWRDSLYRVAATGGQPVVSLAIDPATEIDFHDVSEVPGNRLIVGTHQRNEDGEVPELIDGTRRTVLARDRTATNFRYTRPGFLLFRRRTTNAGVWAVPFSGEPIDVNAATLIQAGATSFDVANDGTLVFVVPAPIKSSFLWVDRAGAMKPVPGATVEIPTPDLALSPDGRRAAFIEGTGPDANVLVRDLETGVDTRLTSNKAQETAGAWSDTRHPAWFPSGERILHTLGRVEADRLVVRRSDVAGEARELIPGRLGKVSPDERTVFFMYDDRGRGRLRRAPLNPDGTVGQPEPVFRGGEEPNVGDIDVSLDGSLLAYTSRQTTGRSDVLITDLPNARDRLVVTEGGSRPRFSPAGGELFFLKGMPDERGQPRGAFMSVPVSNAPTVTIGTPVRLFMDGGTDGLQITGYTVARDGKHFIMSKPVSQQPGEGTRLVLVQNWLAGMKE